MMEVLKFALRVLDCNSIVFADVGKMVYNVVLCYLIFYMPMLSRLLSHLNSILLNFKQLIVIQYQTPVRRYL